MADEPPAAPAVVPVAPGLEVSCEMQRLDGAVEVGVAHEGELVEHRTIAPPDPPKRFRLDLGPLEVDLALGADNARGAVTAEGKVTIDGPGDRDRTLLDFDRVILRYAPAHGSVGGRTEPDPPIFTDQRFGGSRMSSHNVTRVFVEDRERLLADVGRVVKRALWDDYPDWVFNTVACVGEFGDDGRGRYSDPRSIWFNVFCGYYQIDAPKPDWKRPFAYESADGAASRVRFEELVRLGKSDWNYFSNWMYGVPSEVASRHNETEMAKLRTSQSAAGVIGASEWHRVRIDNVGFVSVYEADARGAERLVRNSLVSGLWRKAFGTPCPRPDLEQSFIPTRMDADMYMAYSEDDEAFHTTIFGGTAPTGGDPAFLGLQLAEAAKVIVRAYPELGFNTEVG